MGLFSFNIKIKITFGKETLVQIYLVPTLPRYL